MDNKGYSTRVLRCNKCDELIRTQHYYNGRFFGNSTILKNNIMPKYCPFCGTKVKEGK